MSPSGPLRVYLFEMEPDVPGASPNQFVVMGRLLNPAKAGLPPAQLTDFKGTAEEVEQALRDELAAHGGGPAIVTVIRKIATGEVVHWSPPVPLSEWPFQISEPEARLWRYGDYWKFKSLLEEGNLYFHRSDKLDDKQEGTYTEANQRETSKLFGPAFATGKFGDPARIREIQSTHREHTFLNCWHKNPNENSIMWECYTTGPEAIVVTCTTPRLIAAVGQACQAFDVQYIDEGIAVPEMHSMALFVYKRREKYAFEREFRLAHMPPLEGEFYPDDKSNFSRLIPAAPISFIDELRFHPAATAEFKARVRKDLSAAGLTIPACDSAFLK